MIIPSVANKTITIKKFQSMVVCDISPINPTMDLILIIKMEEAIAFFIGSFPKITNAGMIKNPPPAPTIPVNMPSPSPTIIKANPYTGKTPSTSFLFLPKIMDNAETNIKLAKNNMIKLLLLIKVLPR